MVSEPSSLRPASMESSMADIEPIYVGVGRSFKEVRKRVGTVSDLQSFIIHHFNLPHIQLIECSNGAVAIANLFDGVPDDVQSQDHESFDEINKLLCWISGSIELPECSKAVTPHMFDEMTQSTKTSEVVNIDEQLKNSDELVQIEGKAEPSLVKEPSDSIARQLLDEMPMLIASHEIKSTVLFGGASLDAVVNQPKHLHPKFDHGKVYPQLRKSILETYVNSVACLELHYFDPGGKGFRLGGSLISNENELVHELVDDEYYHKTIHVGSVSDHKTDFYWHFRANSKHGQAKVAQDNVKRVMLNHRGGAYMPRSDLHLARAAILGFEVNQSDLLASEFSHAMVSFTLQKLSLADENDMFKLLHMLTTEGKMIDGSVRVLCFDPGGERMLFGATFFDLQSIGVKSSDKRDLAAADSWIGVNETTITQVVKDYCLAMLIFEVLKSLIDVSMSGEMMVFDPGGEVSALYMQSFKVGHFGKVLALIKVFKSKDFELVLVWDHNEDRKLLESVKWLNFDLRLQVIDPDIIFEEDSDASHGATESYFESDFSTIFISNQEDISAGVGSLFCIAPKTYLNGMKWKSEGHLIAAVLWRRNNHVMTDQGVIACIGENELTFTKCDMCLIHGNMLLIHLIYFRIIINEVVTLILGVSNMHAQWTILLIQAAYENGLIPATVGEMPFDCAGNSTVEHFQNLKLQKHYFTGIHYLPAYMQVIRSSYDACKYDMGFMFIDCDLSSGIKNNIYGSNIYDMERHWSVPCGGPCFGDGVLVFTAHGWHTLSLHASLMANSHDIHMMFYTTPFLIIHKIAHNLVKASNVILIFDPGGDSSKLTTESQWAKCQGSMEFIELLISYGTHIVFIFDPGGECSRFNWSCEVCWSSTSTTILRLQLHLQMFIKVLMFLILEDKDPLKKGVLMQDYSLSSRFILVCVLLVEPGLSGLLFTFIQAGLFRFLSQLACT